MKSILLSLFVIAIIFNVSANTYILSNTATITSINPIGNRKCTTKSKSKTTSCGIGKFKKEPTKAQKIGSGIIPLLMGGIAVFAATSPRRR